MYNERNEKFSIKNVILQFLFILLFIFVLMWLFPMKKDLKSAIEEKNGDTIINNNTTYYVDQVFNSNLLMMKDSAKSYYTLERLPKTVGSKVSMTLGDMLTKKIILPFSDKNGKQCDLVNSYVEITKYETEYVMKVNLKCDEEENYLLVYMGCYDYCSTTICEKDSKDETTPVVYPVKKVEEVKNTNNTTNNNATNNNSVVEKTVINNTTNITNTTTTTITKNINIVNNTDIDIKIEEIVPEKVVETTPDCTLEVVSGTKNGKNYVGSVVVGFKSKNSGANATLTGFGLGTKVNYDSNEKYTLTNPGTYTVYGYVKNSFNKTNVCTAKVTIKEEKKEEKIVESTPDCTLEAKEVTDGDLKKVVINFKEKNAGDNATITGFGLGLEEDYNSKDEYVVDKVGTYIVSGYVKNSFNKTNKCSVKVTIEEKTTEIVKEEVIEETKEEVKEEKVENPNTNVNISLLVSLFIIFGGAGYIVSKKNNYFSKM